MKKSSSRKLIQANWQRQGWKSKTIKKLVSITGVSDDSREIQQGFAFIVRTGSVHKGEDFIEQALSRGAVAIFSKQKLASINKNIATFTSTKFQKSITELYLWFYDIKENKIVHTFITGTNGKTTIAMMLQSLMQKNKLKSMYIGTNGIKINNRLYASETTTPGQSELFRFVKTAQDLKVKYSFIEASSHGIVQGRLNGLIANVAVFTNLSAEHLDYHPSMNAYYLAKKKLFVDLFKNNKNAIGIISIDNAFGLRLYNELAFGFKKKQLISIGKHGMIKIENLHEKWQGYSFDLNFQDVIFHIDSKFIGHFNVYNLAMVFSVAYTLKLDAETIIKTINKLHPPKGRMEILRLADERKVVIDYAHTPDALENVLRTLRELNPIRIIVLFGCGGDRDSSKRKKMGSVASDYGDFIILTNDNPRTEDPVFIVNQIKTGVKTNSLIVIFDRNKAIQMGLKILGKKEVLLIAGKGHENYQIIGSQKNPFSDYEVVKQNEQID